MFCVLCDGFVDRAQNQNDTTAQALIQCNSLYGVTWSAVWRENDFSVIMIS